MIVFRFGLAVLACWRLTHLLVYEDGPFDAIVHLRRRAGKLGGVMDCFYCLSLWIAAPLALAVGRDTLEVFLAWLAISGGACLLERIGQAPVVIQPQQGASHELLRSEPGETGQIPGVDHAAPRGESRR